MSAEKNVVNADRDVTKFDEGIAPYLSKLAGRRKSDEQTRLAAQRVVIESLGPDEELEPYPDGMTVDEVIATGHVRQKRLKAR